MPSVKDLVAQIEERAIRARIKQARKEAGLTQRAIAGLLDVEERTYQNYEREDDRGRTPWGLINAIATATGKTTEWLLHGEAPDLIGSLDGGSQLRELSGRLATVERSLADLHAKIDRGLQLETTEFDRLDEGIQALRSDALDQRPGSRTPRRAGRRRTSAA